MSITFVLVVLMVTAVTATAGLAVGRAVWAARNWTVARFHRWIDGIEARR